MVAGPSGVPSSIVAKQFLLGEGHGFDEWGGLAFVAWLDDESSPVPALYGDDTTLDLIVIEDLGNTRKYGLNIIMQGDDPERATTMLGELMSAV